MTHAEARELMAPYSLGILDEKNLGEVEEHLAGCAFCSNLAREAGEVVDHLAFAPPLRPPPAGGLDRLLSEIKMIEQAASVEGRTEQPAASQIGRRQMPSNRPRFRPGWLVRGLPRLRSPLPVVSALALAFGLAIWNFFLMDHLQADRAEMEELKGRLTGQSELLFMMTSNETISRPLQATSFAPNAQIRLVMDLVNDKAVVMASRLPHLPNGWTYQVWLGRGESRVPAGRLVVDESGNGECSLTATGASSYDSAWITVEPQQGTPLPVSTGVARGNLRQDAVGST